MAGHLLCIAIPVPEPWGSAIDDARRRLQPKRRHMPAHITIIPPFRVADEEMTPLLDVLTQSTAACEPFSVELRGTATFVEGSTTVFLPVLAGSEGCARLQERLRVDVGHRTDLDASSHPMIAHVTIVNRADAAAMAAAAAQFGECEARFLADRVFVYEIGAEGWTLLRAAGFLDTRA